MATLIDLFGATQQVVNVAQAGSGFGGAFSSVSRVPGLTFPTSGKRLASHVCFFQVAEDGSTATNAGRSIGAGNRVLVASFYFRVTAAPASASAMFLFTGPTNPFTLNMATSGALGANFLGGSQQTTATTYADSAWHRVDLRIDTSGTTYTLDWHVDGVAQTQVTRTGQTAADITAWVLGSSTAAHNLTVGFQDFVLSATTGDYPIGDHVVLPLYPTGEGTDSLGATNPIVDEAAANTNLYQHVDDWNGGTPDTTTYVTYTSTTTGDAATDYAEFTFSDPLSVHSTIWDVVIYVAGFAAGTLADNADVQVVDSGGTLIGHAGPIDYSGSTSALGYLTQVLARPSGGWDNTKLSGAKVRWGFSSDTNPLPRLSALLMEYAAPYVTSTAAQSADAVVQKTSSVSQSADAVLAKTIAKTQDADAVISVSGETASHSSDAVIVVGQVGHQSDAQILKTKSAAQSADAYIGNATVPFDARRKVVYPP